MVVPHLPHFIFIPLLAPGHFIPMIDMAKLIAANGISVTVFVTPLIITRYARGVINRAAKSGLPISFIQVPFPTTDAGLPEGCEIADTLTSALWPKFFIGLDIWLVSVEGLIQTIEPLPSCMIADRYLTRLADSSNKLGIPRIIFDGMGCFYFLLKHRLEISKVHEMVTQSDQSFIVPGLHDRIEITREQLPSMFNDSTNKWAEFRVRMKKADEQSYGILINSFEELEINYVEEVRKLNKDRAWCIGPLSAFNREIADKVERGNVSAIDETECSNWLNAQEKGSVIYACFGSLNNLTPAQLVELGLGLEASNRPFIWVLKGGGESKEEMERWFRESGYQERIQGRGLLIHGWAPQVFILSHVAIGGFMTHCGWNSMMEGVCSGVPMVTWPLFAEQFVNEKLVVQILRIGVSVGCKSARQLIGEKEGKVSDDVIQRETIMETIDKVMAGDEEGDERRKRARDVAAMAIKAADDGGSSHRNLKLFMESFTVDNL